MSLLAGGKECRRGDLCIIGDETGAASPGTVGGQKDLRLPVQAMRPAHDLGHRGARPQTSGLQCAAASAWAALGPSRMRTYPNSIS